MLMQAATPAHPAFPSLGDALDPRCAARKLCDELAAAGHVARDLVAEIERVRLKPGRKALIGYRLRGTRNDRTSIDQRMMLTLWPNGDRTRLPCIGVAANAQPGFGPPSMELESLGGTAWFFPNDRKLAGIPKLLRQARAAGGIASIVHYVPEQSCTVRLIRPEGTTYGKVRADDRGAVAVSVYEAAAGRLGPDLRLAPVRSHDPGHRIMWQDAVAGQPLSASEIHANATTWAPRLSSTIAAFHALPPPAGLKRLTPQSILETLRARIARSCEAMPMLTDRLGSLGERFEAFCPIDPGPVLSHCDMHPANLLWDGKSLAVIDLDTCSLAPAALDHAGIAASLAHRLLAQGVEPGLVQTAMAHAGHAAREAEDGLLPAFDWLLAASLVGERLYRCGTRLKSAHAALAGQLLSLAEHHLTLAGTGHD